MKIIYLLIIPTLICSCKKEPVVEIFPEFVGTWTHKESIDKYKSLTILSNSQGEIWYSVGWNVYGDTQTRKWVIKNDYLYFGWVATSFEKFLIDKYPDTSTVYFIDGVDTIEPGNKYMILDGDVFVNKH